MNVWIRGRSESLTAPQAASMSPFWVRASPQITGPSTVRAIASHGLEVARRGDREAGLDHVDAEPGELAGDLDLLLRVQRDARGLLAVAQGRVEDLDPLVSACVAGCSLCRLARGRLDQRSFADSFSLSGSMSFSLAADAPPSAIPPGGGGEGEARGWSCRKVIGQGL